MEEKIPLPCSASLKVDLGLLTGGFVLLSKPRYCLALPAGLGGGKVGAVSALGHRASEGHPLNQAAASGTDQGLQPRPGIVNQASNYCAIKALSRSFRVSII